MLFEEEDLITAPKFDSIESKEELNEVLLLQDQFYETSLDREIISRDGDFIYASDEGSIIADSDRTIVSVGPGFQGDLSVSAENIAIVNTGGDLDISVAASNEAIQLLVSTESASTNKFSGKGDLIEIFANTYTGDLSVDSANLRFQLGQSEIDLTEMEFSGVKVSDALGQTIFETNAEQVSDSIAMRQSQISSFIDSYSEKVTDGLEYLKATDNVKRLLMKNSDLVESALFFNDADASHSLQQLVMGEISSQYSSFARVQQNAYIAERNAYIAEQKDVHLKEFVVGYIEELNEAYSDFVTRDELIEFFDAKETMLEDLLFGNDAEGAEDLFLGDLETFLQEAADDLAEQQQSEFSSPGLLIDSEEPLVHPLAYGEPQDQDLYSNQELSLEQMKVAVAPLTPDELLASITEHSFSELFADESTLEIISDL